VSAEEPAGIFLHIPKTGGSTLHRIVDRQYPADAIYSIGLPVPERVEVFKVLPQADRARIRLLRGHMEFGLHEWLPRPSVYVTVLRDPVERTLSHYSRARSRGRTEGLGLAEFLDAGLRIDLDNGQTRWLSGTPYVAPGEVTPDMLAAAKANLETFAAVGIQESFEESLVLIARALGWRKSLAYRSANLTPGRSRVEDLPASDLEALRRSNRLDEELYAFARERFEAQLEDAGPVARRHAARLRRVSRLVDRLPGPRRAGGGAREPR
jgi:hypothetical protein